MTQVSPPEDVPDSAATGKPARLEGVLDRVVFENKERGFAVVEVVASGGARTVVKGNLLGARSGERLRVIGEWEVHPRFGAQVRARTVEVVPPSTADGVRAYLGSGLVKGIGPALAARIVETLGPGAIDLIETDPRQLRRVPGIGTKKAKSIAAAVASQRGIREFVAFLAGHGVSARAAQRIWGHYGADALRLVRENPFRLADDVWGFGFRKADEIAAKLGLPADSIERARAGIIFSLGESSGAGHTCTPKEYLILRSEQLLQAEGAPVREALAICEKERAVVFETKKPVAPDAAPPSDSEIYTYLPQLVAAERIVAKQLLKLLNANMPRPLADVAALDAAARRAQLQLHPQQREAVAAALHERALVITGGPGVGKTTITRLIVDLAKRAGGGVLLASPTGRAARRLSEATGCEASTIHRLLEFNPHSGRFVRNENNPLLARILIVDESSMIDVSLAAHLLRAVQPPTRIVFVGDANQLPSVGPGNILNDIIESGVVPVVKLSKVYRQGNTSGIVEGAHEILNGHVPEFSTMPAAGGGDLFFIERDDPFETLKTLVHIVCERIPERYQLNSRTDVQVITPMYRGEAGVDRVNRELRQQINPVGTSIGNGEKLYRIGDRVMATRNDVDRDVFNGDIGFIKKINPETRSLNVDFGERDVEFKENQISDLVPAYAISVHRSQGSEYPAVVIPLVTQHFVMLRRPLLYTAITRARKLCVLIGSRRALEIAVRDARSEERFSLLKDRLLGKL